MRESGLPQTRGAAPGGPHAALSAQRAAAIALLVVFALTGATLRLFFWPASARPTRVDAVVVLSGQWRVRLAEGERLVRAGVAKVLVFVGRYDSDQAEELCTAAETPFEVVCLHPRPDNTRNEAKVVASLARQRGWDSLAVVTSVHHVTRAGVLFRHCHDGPVAVVATNLSPFAPRLTAQDIVREWVGLLHGLTVGIRC